MPIQATQLEYSTEFRPYLKATGAIDFIHPIVSKLITTKKNGLKLNFTSQEELAVQLFEFVRDKIQYRIPNKFLTKPRLKASYVITQGGGNCAQKSLVLIALARKFGIPARLHFVNLINHAAPRSYVSKWGRWIAWHGYTELYLHEKWVAVNPDYPTSLCKKLGYPVVQFDGKHDALLPSTTLTGDPFIEYQEDQGHYADLPLRKMQWHYAKTYLPPFIGFQFRHIFQKKSKY